MPIVRFDCWGLECPACGELIDLDGDGMLGRLTEAQAREEIPILCDANDIMPGETEDETIQRLCGCQDTEAS